MSHQKNRKIRQLKTRNNLAILGVFLLILSGILFLPQFRLHEVEVVGCRVLSPDLLIETARLNQGDHIFYGIRGSFNNVFQLRHTEREKLLRKTFPYIKNIIIQSQYPSTVSVLVEERIEIAYISIRDGYVMIDSSGIALEVIEKQGDSPAQVPVIEGIQANIVRLGEKIDVDMDDYLNQAIILLNDVIRADNHAKVDVQLLSNMKSIRPVKERLLYVTMSLSKNENSLLIRIRHSERTLEDLIWLKHAIDQGAFDNYKNGILDLTTTERFITS
jgi:hypothetical protein